MARAVQDDGFRSRYASPVGDTATSTPSFSPALTDVSSGLADSMVVDASPTSPSSPRPPPHPHPRPHHHPHPRPPQSTTPYYSKDATRRRQRYYQVDLVVSPPGHQGGPSQHAPYCPITPLSPEFPLSSSSPRSPGIFDDIDGMQRRQRRQSLIASGKHRGFFPPQPHDAQHQHQLQLQQIQPPSSSPSSTRRPGAPSPTSYPRSPLSPVQPTLPTSSLPHLLSPGRREQPDNDHGRAQRLCPLPPSPTPQSPKSIDMDQAAAVAALRQSRHSLHSFVAASCSDPNMGVVCNITTGPELAGNDEGNGFSVDDAIEMYLDGFSDADDGDGDEEMADAAEELTSPSNHTSAGETISSEAAAASHGWPLSDSGTQGVCETLPESHTFQQPGATALGQHAPASAQLSPAEKRLSLNPLSSNPVLLRTDMALHADHRRSSAILAQKPRERFELPSDFTRTPPPPLTRGSPTRDRYGFHKTSAGGITLEQYDRWNHSYAPYQEERRKKWSDLIEHTTGAHGQHVIFPAKSNKIKRLIRKGIPPEYRGAAWFNYSGGDQIYHKNPGLYRRLVEEAWDSDMNDDKEHIERDLHRTFPDNMHFKPDTSEANDSEGSASGTSDSVRTTPSEPGIIQSLRRVLYAFALHNSKIGYTQSLNFIAGMLLLLLPEEKAFWMLHVITSRYLPATHEINLEGADVDLWILMVLLREQLPVVYSKIADTHSTNRNKPPVMEESADLPVITLGLTNWLMSLFLGSLPWETTLRVWDVFFYEGSRTFFRVGLGIFRSCESRILAVNDSSEIFQIVQKAPKKLLDANAFIEDCFSKKYHRITQQRIENLRRARRRALHAKREEMHAPSGQTSCAASDHMRPKTGHTWRSLRHHAFNRI